MMNTSPHPQLGKSDLILFGKGISVAAVAADTQFTRIARPDGGEQILFAFKQEAGSIT